MKELFYIARIDARPWAGSAKASESLIPFVLFFASVEMTRYVLNAREAKLPEFEKYFILGLVTIVLVYGGDIGSRLTDMSRRHWRSSYTTKLVQDIFCTALVSTAAFNAASILFALPSGWELRLDPSGAIPDFVIRMLPAFATTIVGVAYLALRTCYQRRLELHRFRSKPSAKHFQKFRATESRYLRYVYVAHFLCAGAFISFLIAN